jgi:hypothetical protein
MIMTPRARKAALVVHVVSSVGWLGSAAAFLALAVVGLSSSDARVVRAAYPAMELVTGYVIVPSALAALATGLIQALGTRWGLFRHYWVVMKLVVTAVATLVLLQQLGPIGQLADAAMDGAVSRTDMRSMRTSMVLHSAGGLAVLLVPTALSVFKPRGLTRYGRRRQQAQRSVASDDRPVSVT